MPKKILQQHIAVFGESGSGKTVLLSSFYGLMREERTQERISLDVVADDAGQGDRLMQNYLGMSRDGHVPQPNRFSATPYSFTAHLKHRPNKAANEYDGIQLVWHDYPGEWFHESPSGPEEAERRAETFRSLLASDVAIILIDGERMAKSAGKEAQYLKLLFTNVRNGLLPVVDELLDSGKPLVRFPRIWMFALSKADVLPELDASELQKLVQLHAAHEVNQLREMLRRVVLDKSAMSVGEDFVRLSSAKFAPGVIEVEQRIGIELILPIASVFPLGRFLRWAEARKMRGKLVKEIFNYASGAAGLVAVIVGFIGRAAKIPGPIGVVVALISSVISKEMIEKAVQLAGKKLEEAHADALKKGDYLRAALLQFAQDLEKGEKRKDLLRSPR